MLKGPTTADSSIDRAASIPSDAHRWAWVMAAETAREFVLGKAWRPDCTIDHLTEDEIEELVIMLETVFRTSLNAAKTLYFRHVEGGTLSIRISAEFGFDHIAGVSAAMRDSPANAK